MVTITSTPVDAVLPTGATLRGRRWDFPALMPWSGDVSAEANTYRTRNGGKTRSAHVWLGVRYAHPPVGDRRFRSAQDYAHPVGVHDCATWPDVPHQVQTSEEETGDPGNGAGLGRPEWGNANGAYLWSQYPNPVSESEDCLRLNVFRPTGALPAGFTGWPVVVWFHGGAWVANSAINYRFLGHRLAAEGVMLVTVEYRLSNFGFHYHPDFGDGPNFALSDMKSSLRWVQANIGAFGGDAANVTIGGSSAGGSATLALLQDDSAQTLFTRAWVTSGGGSQVRRRQGVREDNEGYGKRYDRFHRVISKVAPYMRDMSNPSRTVAQAIAADGMAKALREALPVPAIMALSDGRDRYTAASIRANAPTKTYRASQNLYPFQDNTSLVYPSDIAAAFNGKIRKTVVLLAAENEASAVGGAAEWASIPATGYLRWLNYFDYAEWQRAVWVNAAWGDTENKRLIYNQVVFQYPAWRIARACNTTGSATAYLCLWNWNGQGTGYAGHASDVQALFGNAEWSVSKQDGEAKLDHRALQMVDAMQRAFIRFAATGNPNTAYGYAGGFSLFAVPLVHSFAAYNVANEYHWNVIGNNSRNANAAPNEVRHEAYFGAAWADYFAKAG